MNPMSEPRPLLPDRDNRLTVDEVRLLWSFVHGDIMDGPTRERLRRSFGLCRRHAWGHAVVEIELWQSGAGRRGGHQPFDVTVLLEDLMDHAASVMATTHQHRLLRALRGEGECMICRDLTGGEAPGLGYAGSDSVALTDEANSMTFTTRWLQETRHCWAALVCPACAVDAGQDVQSGGVICRRHLLGSDQVDSSVIHDVREALEVLPDRLHRMSTSMTESGPASTPDEDASWVVALGWLSGWDLPLAVAE